MLRIGAPASANYVMHPTPSDPTAMAPSKFKPARRPPDQLDTMRLHHVTPHFGAKLREGTLYTCAYQMPPTPNRPERHLISSEN